MLRIRFLFSPLLACFALLLTPLKAVRADLVTDWNAEALSAMRTGVEAPVMTRDLAILHTAIFNAAESIRGAYITYGMGSYTAPTGGPLGASVDAAMASAANTVMQGLYGGSSSAFTSLYNAQMGAIADGQAKSDGIAWGASIAGSMLTWRSTDQASAAAGKPYSPLGLTGYWQETSATTARLPGWGDVRPFAISGTAGYISSLPGSSRNTYLQGAQYAADYNQVQEWGGSSSSSRTADQLNQAYFWSAPDGTVKVPGMWNQVAQSVALGSGMAVTDTARLFAAMNVSMADASIVSFATAYDQEFWRPVTAIANGDNDPNSATFGDEGWAPLINSPSFPEYIALGSALSSAAATVLGSYTGSSYSFSLGSDIDGNGSTDLTRLYSSFRQAANEAGMSGVYGGTQFLTSVTDGQTMGASVANFVVNNNFALVPEPAGAFLMLLGAGAFLLGRRRSV